MAKTKRAAKNAADSDPALADRWAWLTSAGFFLALALVIARATMLEYLRDPFDVVPNGPAIPRGPGPTSGLVLDLLCCVPALLVLLRRALDRAYVIRWSWSLVFAGLLGLWTVLSVFWSADKFGAVIPAAHFLAAMALLWAMSQLVRSWLRLKLVAAMCFGLLLVYVTAGFMYRYMEWPDLVKSWDQSREKILRERGWEKDSFAARQFERKVVGGEMVGFGASPNTFAATIVLLAIVSAGAMIQRISDEDEPAWAVAIAIGLLLAAWVVWFTDSRTALLTPFLAAGCLWAIGRWRGWLAAHARFAYATGVGAVVLVGSAVVAHGLMHGSLVHESLTFRWKYWVGSTRLFAEHWLTGVGWNNFGLHYLGVRLAEASEEIKDPHNFIVRTFVELGIIGGGLLVAWMLRLWWEVTRPIQPAAPQTKSPDGRNTIVLLLTVGAAGFLFNALASIDTDPASFSESRPGESAMAWYVVFEVLKRVLYLGVLVIGMTVVALRSSQQAQADPRPAPWVLYAMLVGLGIFLLHNLIDFSLYETGPLFLFALLCGAALGLRMPPTAGHKKHTRLAIGATVGAFVLWFMAAVFFVIPIAEAEALAHQADDDVRAGRLSDAAGRLQSAYAKLPINAEYAFRAARAMIMGQAPRDQVRAALGTAISANEMAVEYRLTRADYELNQNPVDQEQVYLDFKRATELDPNDVSMRLSFADALRKFGQSAEAKKQYELALDYNDRLSQDEPKRLSDDRVAQIRRAIEESE